MSGGPAPKRSLFELLGELPALVSALIRAEIDALKADLKERAIRAGVGLGLIGGAVFVLLLAVVVAIIAAIAGLATVLPFWASALVIFGALVLIALAFGFAGAAALKSTKGMSERFAKIGDDFRLLSRDGRDAARAAQEGKD